jgi:hypothetical protein
MASPRNAQIQLRTTAENYGSISGLAEAAGLGMSQIVDAIVDRARSAGWTVQPVTVTTGEVTP